MTERSCVNQRNLLGPLNFPGMNSLAPDQLAARSRLFSPAIIRQLARTGRSPLLARLLAQSGLASSLPAAAPVGTLFDAAFASLIKEGARNEYVFKAALTNRVLVGKHSLRTASMSTEFRVDDCKADLVIFNGTATAYEIKSERDSLVRLERQLSTYPKVFTKTCVVAAEQHLDAIQRIAPKYVGILCLNKRFQLSVVREPLEHLDEMSAGAIFDSIRVGEAKKILVSYGMGVPHLPNTVIRGELRRVFCSLRPIDAHAGMVRTLKATRDLRPLTDLVGQLPRPLYAVALAVPLRKIDHSRLVAAINTPLREAFDWV